MEAQRTQQELNNMIHTNQRHAETVRRMERIEKNIELILEILVKENIKKKG